MHATARLEMASHDDVPPVSSFISVTTHWLHCVFDEFPTITLTLTLVKSSQLSRDVRGDVSGRMPSKSCNVTRVRDNVNIPAMGQPKPPGR